MAMIVTFKFDRAMHTYFYFRRHRRNFLGIRGVGLRVPGRGSAPDPAGGAYSTPPNPLVRLRALLLKEREREGNWYPTFWEKVTPCPSAKLNLQEIFFQ